MRHFSWTAFVVVLLVAVPALAQIDRGQIAGFVKDQSGGVIPGAAVTAISTQTRLERTVVTDANGYYVIPGLSPGLYDVSVELQGFKKWIQTGVTLDAASSAKVDVTLETGVISELVTVTAEATPLQSDVAVRKTIEAKDIELLSFSGRNPIGVVGLKAGVMGGAFNSRGFDDLGNGGFNINGSRADENTISIDGAIGVRTRSTGTIIGIQNVDAVQEVQVLTANYMPEYGRASGGQIRFVTKGGSSRYSGSGSVFYRDESLQANTWTRNRSTNPAESSGPAPFDYKQYGYSFGGPMPGDRFRDKFFFFGAQEWVDFFQLSTNTATVPTEAMRRGDFSELLNPANGFFNSARTIIDPLTGQPFPGNIIPVNRLSPNGLALLNTYPAPTPGFRQNTANLIQTSENPRDQRKDTLRLDYRLTNAHQFTYRYSASDWTAVDAFRGTFPFARTDWHRPNATQIFSWTSTLSSNLLNELSYSYSLDEVFIDVFTETGFHKRSRTGITYPYLFPGKEIDDKIPTVTIGGFSTIDGGPYPAFSRGPIHALSNTTTMVKGRHTLKAGVVVEYSGEDDFDQINVAAIPGGTNNQNGAFDFQDNRAAGTGLAIANVALGLFSNYAEIGQRALTKWRALATDVFVQDSWKPRSNLTIEGGIRWAFWPPWYSTTNNIANFDPRFYDAARAAVINPSTGRLVGGDRFNGIVLPGDGFEGDGSSLVVAQDPRVQALFRDQPRGFSDTHYNAIEPRLGLAYSINDKTIARVSSGVFHNRVTLNDSTLLGGNPPFQPMVVVSNGLVDNPAGVGSATDLPFGINAQDPVFKHPTAYMWSAGVQREVPFGFVVDVSYVGRRGLYLQRERNINQLTAGTLNANRGVNIAALRPYKGYGAIRLSENAGRSIYHSLQVSADRRYSNGLKVGVAYTLGKSMDNASNKRDVMYNTYDDSSYWGPSSYDRRHVMGVYYIYDLPLWRGQETLLKSLLGGWQISGASFFRTGTPFSVLRTNDIAGVGDGAFGQPYNLVGDPKGSNPKFSQGASVDNNMWFNPAAFAAPAAGTFGNAPRNLLYNPGQQQWDIALFKNFAVGGTRRLQFRAEIFNFPNHPNLGNAQTGTVTGGGAGFADPTNANFGRVTTKTNDRREIQLSLRYQF